MYATVGDADAAFEFITPTIIFIVIMQQTQREKKQNGYTMHVMRIIGACDHQKQKQQVIFI
jgi:hypothetical protein